VLRSFVVAGIAGLARSVLDDRERYRMLSLYTQLAGQLAPGSTTIVVALLATGAVVTLGAAVVFRASGTEPGTAA
jgi:hypothetical protein